MSETPEDDIVAENRAIKLKEEIRTKGKEEISRLRTCKHCFCQTNKFGDIQCCKCDLRLHNWMNPKGGN